MPKEIETIHMDSEKSINSFEIIKSDRLPIFLLDNFFCQSVDKFSILLLCKINVFRIFNIVDFFHNFITPQNTEILIE